MKVIIKLIFIIIVLTCCLSVSISATSFSDVSIGNTYRDSINYVTDNNLIDGTSSNTFSPDNGFTRADVATMFYRYMGSPNISVTNAFSDVSSADSYAKAVSWVYSNGIMSGSGNGNFNPERVVVRQELIVAFYRFANVMHYNTNVTGDLSEYLDANLIADYAIDAVEWSVGTHFIEGAFGYLMPTTTVSRKVASLFMVKYGLYIEGIVMGRDNYNFRSSDNMYGSSNSGRYISNVDYSNLQHYVRQYSSNVTTDLNRIDFIKTNNNKIPNFGMAVTVLLDKIGKVDIDGNFGTSIDQNMNSLSSNNASVVSAINFYELTQYISCVNTITKTDIGEGNDQIIDKIEEMGAYLFSIDVESNGATYSCCVVGSKLKQRSDGIYSLMLYSPDNNDTIEMCLEMDNENGSAKINYGGLVYYNVKKYKFYDFSLGSEDDPYLFFDLYDIDSNFNNIVNTTTLNSTFYDEKIVYSADNEVKYDESQNTVSLYVTLNEDFIITNAKGEYISYIDGNIDGTMKIRSYTTYANGIEIPADAEFIVDDSESFSFLSLKNISNKFYVLTKNNYIGADQITQYTVCVI